MLGPLMMIGSPSSRGLKTEPARSALMRRVRREDTSAEMRVRRFLHASGLRYILHPQGMPGRPDIVLPRRRAVVFVHGCFWHGHTCSHGRARPRTNTAYWAAKLSDNRKRDRRKAAALRRLGWTVIVVWECQAANPPHLARLANDLLAR